MEGGFRGWTVGFGVEGTHLLFQAFALLRHEPAHRLQCFLPGGFGQRRLRQERIERIEQAEVAGTLQRSQALRAGTVGRSIEMLLDLPRHRTQQQVRRLGADQVQQPGPHHLVVPGLTHGAGKPLKF